MLIITNKQLDKLIKRITQDARSPRAVDLGAGIVFSHEDRERVDDMIAAQNIALSKASLLGGV